ncbi:4-hydroxy-3-methylbut-2-enyl diphosphate reductase [Amycolatopsis sp. cg5]|uniref:4-hydroxy-3-methylbut-2-enyl diphosphate reductase n=1 Tax=Amycolatopsis sp. cg5 TaxID=3238802 RepID=UPI0035263ACD
MRHDKPVDSSGRDVGQQVAGQPVARVVVSSVLQGMEGVRRCEAVDLLRGSLRRKGIPVERVSAFDARDGDFALYEAPGLEGTTLFVGVHGISGAMLDEVRSVVDKWAAVRGDRNILLPSPRSFCAGVERAIKIVEKTLERRTNPVFVRKEIVHNKHVVADLAQRGATFVDELDEVPDGATVVFSAHGVSPAVREEAARRGLEVIDGTCPLVTKVHSEARRFAARGDTIVLIGHAGHEEVEGTMGEAPASTILVETVEDVEGLEVVDPAHVSYLTQTTLAVDETAEVVSALRKKLPLLNEPPTDDICYATTNRQNSLQAVIEESDLVLVVGSGNSSNSVRLVELARRQGTPAQLIDDTGDIRPEWLSGKRVIGLTAGASAPPFLVNQVIAAIGGLGQTTVVEREFTEETLQFGLPSAVREGQE